MNQFKYDELETKTETYIYYILEIEIREQWRFVFKFRDKPSLKESKEHISVFLKHQRYIYNYEPKNYKIRLKRTVESRKFTSAIKYLW